MDPNLIPDGTGPIAAAILTAGGALVWALKGSLGRLVKSFDKMTMAIDSNTTAQHVTAERVTRVEAVVQEGREDIAEIHEDIASIRDAVVRVTEEPIPRRSRVRIPTPVAVARTRTDPGTR